ncbi:hypothetical protein FLAN108750_10025 [Flavobacterium antarcticum]|uniref:hypothetical protein n=1 Tax=Flavobacterium antarcticum TaxID=271155 RepID=UPI0003B741D3|nr:hypothetical protein [Flavobacterium antarcticum]
MKDKAILIEMLFEKVESYTKTSLELYRLKAIDKITDVFATIASGMIIALIIALFFILISVGLALYLGEVLGKTYYGFFALGGFYALVAIIIAMNRRAWLESKLNDFIINQTFKKKDNVHN